MRRLRISPKRQVPGAAPARKVLRAAGRRLFVDLVSLPRTIAWPSSQQATLVLLALGLVWRTIRYLQAFPLWNDEAFLAVNFLTRSLAGLSKPPEFNQVAPPGFLWIEWLSAHWLGGGERALRLVPYLASVGSLVLFWRFCRKVADPSVVLVAVGLLAASFYPVRHGNEVKPYIVDLFVALALMSLVWRVRSEPRAPGRWLALIAAAVVGVWLSYPAVFPAASVGVLLLNHAWRDRAVKLLGGTLAYGLLFGASWAAMTVLFTLPQATASLWLPELSTWRDAFPPLARPWKLPGWLLDVHAGNMLAYPHGGHHFGSTPTFLLVVTGAWTMARTPGRRELLWLLLGPLPFALIAAALHKYPYGTSARVMLYMAPAFCLLAAEGLIVAFGKWGRTALERGPIVVVGLLAVMISVYTVRDLAMPYVRWDDLEKRRIVREWARASGPRDQWVVFDGATPLPQYHEVMLSRWIQRVAEFRYDVLSSAPGRVRWEPDPSTVNLPEGGRLWLIVHDHGCAPIYPRARLIAYEKALSDRLGPPRTSSPQTVDFSTFTVHVYSPSEVAGSFRGVATP